MTHLGDTPVIPESNIPPDWPPYRLPPPHPHWPYWRLTVATPPGSETDVLKYTVQAPNALAATRALKQYLHPAHRDTTLGDAGILCTAELSETAHPHRDYLWQVKWRRRTDDGMPRINNTEYVVAPTATSAREAVQLMIPARIRDTAVGMSGIIEIQQLPSTTDHVPPAIHPAPLDDTEPVEPTHQHLYHVHWQPHPRFEQRVRVNAISARSPKHAGQRLYQLIPADDRDCTIGNAGIVRIERPHKPATKEPRS